MLEIIIRDHVGADALVRPAEQGSAEANHQQPTADDWPSAIGQSLAQLLKRPEITIERLLPVLRELAPKFFEEETVKIRANPCPFPPRLATNSSRSRRRSSTPATPAAAARHRASQKGRAAHHSAMVRLPLGQRPLARDTGNADQNPSLELWGMRRDSRRDAGRCIPGARVYRNSVKRREQAAVILNPLRREVFLRVLRVLCG